MVRRTTARSAENPLTAADGSSEKWIRRAKDTASSTAWEWIHRRYQERLLRHAGRLLGGRLRAAAAQDAEDLVHETWARALPALDEFEYRGPRSLDRLLRLKAAQVAAEWGRRGGEGRREFLARGQLPLDAAAAQPARLASPSSIARRREDLGRLERAFGRLPRSYQQAVSLCVLEHKSLEEFAAIVGRSPETARKIRHRAITRWRELIEADAPAWRHAGG
jgi:RNA polymerase sigma factor (sigma-70 family)